MGFDLLFAISLVSALVAVVLSTGLGEPRESLDASRQGPGNSAQDVT
jgi:hypothetical protein